MFDVKLGRNGACGDRGVVIPGWSLMPMNALYLFVTTAHENDTMRPSSVCDKVQMYAKQGRFLHDTRLMKSPDFITDKFSSSNFTEKIGRQNRPILSFVCHRL